MTVAGGYDPSFLPVPVPSGGEVPGVVERAYTHVTVLGGDWRTTCSAVFGPPTPACRC